MIAPKGMERLDDSDENVKYCISKSATSSLVVATAGKNKQRTTTEGTAHGKEAPALARKLAIFFWAKTTKNWQKHSRRGSGP